MVPEKVSMLYSSFTSKGAPLRLFFRKRLYLAHKNGLNSLLINSIVQIQKLSPKLIKCGSIGRIICDDLSGRVGDQRGSFGALVRPRSIRIGGLPVPP
ncbi:MAG TPA: hypothetical protein DCE24_07300 [Porphyromonadaceae bacterium]|nr:hypothetical protein [Porphyromonadaceae bacterium]